MLSIFLVRVCGGTLVFPKRCSPTRLGALVCCGFNFIPTYSLDKCWLNSPKVWALESGLERGIRRSSIRRPWTGLPWASDILLGSSKDAGALTLPIRAPFPSLPARSLPPLIFSLCPLTTSPPASCSHPSTGGAHSLLSSQVHSLLITQTATPGIQGSTSLVPHFLASVAAGRKSLCPLPQRLLDAGSLHLPLSPQLRATPMPARAHTLL